MVDLCERLEHVSWVVAIAYSTVGSLIVELTHYFSFFALVGMIAIVDLRVLGITDRRQTATQLADDLFPWIWTGLAFNVLSGLLMFAGAATTFCSNSVFHAKLLVILLAVIFGVIVERNVRKWDGLPTMPTGAKLLALVSLLLWIGAILSAVEVPHLTYVP
jgi:uncharacterized membrane protein